MQKQTKKIITKKVDPVVATPLRVTRPNAQMQGPSKTFQQDGHWIEKPNKTAILICTCGNRYLKTRAKQEQCLRCMSAAFTRR